MPEEMEGAGPNDLGRPPETFDIEAHELLEVLRDRKALKHELKTIAEADVESEPLRMALALGKVIEFLQRDPEILKSKMLKPLLDLMVAMHDLSFGGKPPVLFEAKQPDGVVTKPKITFTHYVQGTLAATYAALVNPYAVKNPRRDGMKPAKARKLLDEMLRERNLDVSGINLQAWCYQVDSGSAAPMVIEAFQSRKPVLAKLSNEMEAKACAAEWLDVVADLQLRSLKLRHSPPGS